MSLKIDPRMLKPDATHSGEKVPRSRQRTSTSCTECRRRKQKCNQARDRPCNNCTRRYPPVPCVYETLSKSSKKVETVISLEVTRPKVEESETPTSELLSSLQTYRSNKSRDLTTNVPLWGTYSLPLASRSSSVSALVGSTSQDEVSTQSGRGTDLSFDFQHLTRLDIAALEARKASLHKTGDHFDAIHDVDIRSPYFPYPHLSKDSYFGIMQMHMGSSAVDPLHLLPIESSRRNAELLHMFIQRLSPYMTSMDGLNPSQSFNDQWLPFMIQSPIIVYIGILTAAYFQAVARGVEVEKSVDAITARVKIISMINEHLTSNTKGVTDEAIAAVMSLAYNELIYSDKRSTLAHMRGLREMIRARGGFESITLDPIRKMLVRTDCQIACTFECDPLLQDDDLKAPIPILETYPLELDSPLLQSSIHFIDSTTALDISTECASILDDMRFLTTSLLSLNTDETSEQENSKFITTVEWIHKRLNTPIDSDLATDYIYQSCRTAATIYSAAILSQTPLSLSCTSQLLQQLWMTMWRVPLSRWKQTPSIFFWIVLVVTPFARDKPEGRFLKGMIAAGTIAIGLVDWDVVTCSLKGFLAVQRWLAKGLAARGKKSKNEDRESVSPRHRTPENVVKV